jgi:hypothetical protein
LKGWNFPTLQTFNKMKQIFFTPQYPDEPKRGMGYIEIEEKFVNKIGIRRIYQPDSYGGFSHITAPDGSKFTAYCDQGYFILDGKIIC